MVNRGYQAEDERYIDYQLWRLPSTQLDVRGPQGFDQANYFCAIGAAQTFGRFCHDTYSSLLSRWLKVSSLNLGFSGAGPSFFLSRPKLIDLINDSRFCIVQVMSGRSVNNSQFELGVNQGIVRRRGSEERHVFAETAYVNFLRDASEEEAITLRHEIQENYIEEYKQLASRIKVPTILFYFSVRRPGTLSGLRSIGEYWGSFPHFVDQHIIDEIRPFFSNYVEVVTDRGLPQTIIDQKSGEQYLLWDKHNYPNIKHRCHNLYYPSPQMQLDAALALVDVARPITIQSIDPEEESGFLSAHAGMISTGFSGPHSDRCADESHISISRQHQYPDIGSQVISFLYRLGYSSSRFIRKLSMWIRALLAKAR